MLCFHELDRLEQILFVLLVLGRLLRCGNLGPATGSCLSVHLPVLLLHFPVLFLVETRMFARHETDIRVSE